MMGEIQFFDFESHEVRVVLGDDGDPRWVAEDLCRSLDIINVTQALGRLDDDEKGLCSIYTPGGTQEMLVVTESGLYSLTLGSRKLVAKRFKKFITSVILPAIRKTGKFEIVSTSDHHEDGELVRFARVIEKMRREQDRQRDEMIHVQGETIRALKIALEAKEASHEAKEASHEAKEAAQNAIVDAKHAEMYVSVVGYANKNKIPVNNAKARAIGKIASSMCRAKGIAMGVVTNERWGECHSYPYEILAEAFDKYFGKTG